jgi:hypothetical protein
MVFGASASTGSCLAAVGFSDGVFCAAVLDDFLVPLAADAAFARAFLAVAVVREDGFRRVGFAGTLAGFFFDMAIGRRSHPVVSASAGAGEACGVLA